MALQTFPSLRGIAWPVKRSPVWSTDPQDSMSGKSIRIEHFSYPRYRYELKFTVLRTALGELAQLLGFINIARGSSRLWQFDDPDDDAVTAQEFGEGDGVSVAFQLVRSIGDFAEPVFLVNGTPTIFVAGVAKTPGTDYTISAYGVVTFAVAPANGALLTWTGSYFWPCRFDSDITEFVRFMSGFNNVGSLKFTTEKLP